MSIEAKGNIGVLSMRHEFSLLYTRKLKEIKQKISKEEENTITCNGFTINEVIF